MSGDDGQRLNEDGSLVRLEDVQKWFGEDLYVLKDVDLSVAPGEVVVVIGPSGSGKSTLLRTINLLEEPTEGRVWFEGRELTDIRADLNEARTHIGIVFQQFNLFPHKKVVANVTLALRKVLKLREKEARERALAQLGRSASPTRRTRTPVSFRAASSSGWRSRARSRCGRASCSSTR